MEEYSPQVLLGTHVLESGKTSSRFANEPQLRIPHKFFQTCLRASQQSPGSSNMRSMTLPFLSCKSNSSHWKMQNFWFQNASDSCQYPMTPWKGRRKLIRVPDILGIGVAGTGPWCRASCLLLALAFLCCMLLPAGLD